MLEGPNSPKIFYILFYSLDSLDDLTNLVIKLFSGVEDKNISVPEFPVHPYGDEQLQVRKVNLPVIIL